MILLIEFFSVTLEFTSLDNSQNQKRATFMDTPIEQPPLNNKDEVEDEKGISAQGILLESQKIRAELEKLNSHKLLQTYNTTSGILLALFLKGMAFGLGTIIGATIIASVFIYFLSFFEVVPYIGNWVKRIIEVVGK